MIRWWGYKRKEGSSRSQGQEIRNSGENEENADVHCQFFDLLPDPVWICDPEDQRLLTANAAAVSFYGYSKSEFLNMRIHELALEDERERMRRAVQDLRPGSNRSGPWRHRRKDGTLLDVEIMSESMMFKARPARLVLVHDITQRLLNERDLDRLGRAYRMLARLSIMLSDVEEEQVFLTEACRLAVDEGGYAMAWVGYAREDETYRIEPMAVYGDHPGYVHDVFVSWNAERPEGRGPAGTAVRELRPVHVDDLRKDERFLPWREQAVRRGYASCLALPFRISMILRGVLVLYSQTVQPFKRDWMSVFEQVAAVLADGVVQIRRKKSLQTLNRSVYRIASFTSRQDVRLTLKQIVTIAVEALEADLGMVTQVAQGAEKPRVLALCSPRWPVDPNDLRFAPDFWNPVSPSDEVVFRRTSVGTVTASAGQTAQKIAYARSPVVAANGKTLGFLYLCYSDPPEETDVIASALRLFALRIGSELERSGLEQREIHTIKLLNGVHTAVVVWDSLRRIVFWNQGATEIYGWTRDEALGQELNFLIPDPEELHSLIANVESEERWKGRTRVTTKTGEEKFVELNVNFVPGNDDTPSSTLAIGTDVTIEVRLEEQLRQTERLEVIGRLTGGVAHDFNNLLTVILGNSELLIEKLCDQPRARELAETISQAAQSGASLTQSLLAFARKQPLKLQSVRINAVLTSWHDMIRRTLGSDIEVELIQGAGLWEVMIDPRQLELALLNLCLNARDAMPQGGHLTIETSNVWIDRNYAEQYPDVQPGQYVLVAVSDTGTGIHPEHLSRVFEPFFTTKETGKGTGLGLSMVYGFIKQLHGHIKIYSELNRGTTVKMYVPKSGSSAHEQRPQSAQANEPLPLQATVLMVEDNEMIRRFASEQLREVGYRVLEASTAAEALDWIRQSPQIDLLFADVVLPGGMSGKQLADVARERIPGLRILFASGYTENAIVHHGIVDSGVHLLNKPYTRSDLLRMIRAVFAEGRDHERL
jgi:PAS domain S-box-containing protein